MKICKSLITRSSVFAILALVNAFILVFLAGTNRLMTNDEARRISAGVSHWSLGEFTLAHDDPPLARMAAVLPLLPLRLNSEAPAAWGDDPDKVRDRELRHAGRFAGINEAPFNLFFIARMTGFFWWLLGAVVIFRWSSDLHGAAAGCLSVALWCVAPNVLAYEQIVSPKLPAAVICTTATYVFRGYLSAPTWARAFASGLLLGVAQLIGFVSLSLFVIWPLLALARRLVRGKVPSPIVWPRTRKFQEVSAVALCLYVLNVGYGFDGSGTPLGSFDFTSRILGGARRLAAAGPTGGTLGNRFRGTWPGRIVIPVPVDYLRGLDRRWHEWEIGRPNYGEDVVWPVEVAGRPPHIVGRHVPISIQVLLLGSLILVVSRWTNQVSRAEEWTLWLPLAAVLAMTTHFIGPFDPAVGILLASPFAIIIASRLAISWRSRRWKTRWLAVLFSLGVVVETVKTTYDEHVTLNRVARFRQDMVRQTRKVGLTLPNWGISAAGAARVRGLYRTFTDSQGVDSHYALFVPENYRGDRPYPLILFLHGFGDRGTSDRKYAEVGLPFILKYRDIGFLVLCPQGRSGNWEANGDDARRAMELLAEVQQKYRVDSRRISLSGLSSGGTGVWRLAARYPDRWAAIVPVAASCDPGLALSVKNIPCWCFHNRYDGIISVEGVRAMYRALRAVGGDPRYTEYTDTFHNAGERAYVHPELYDWLSQQRLPPHPM